MRTYLAEINNLLIAVGIKEETDISDVLGDSRKVVFLMWKI